MAYISTSSSGKESSRLCTVIIEQDFGPVVANVVSVVLNHGRLPLPLLARYAGLKPRIVRSALLVLIQHNAMWHCELGDSPDEYFEANPDEILSRLRFGRFVRLAEEQEEDEEEGRIAREVIATVLAHGKLRAPDLLDKLPPEFSLSKRKKLLLRLISSASLIPVSASSHISPRDKLLRWEKELRAGIKGIITPKEIKNIKEQCQRRWLAEQEAERGASKGEDGVTVGMKRKHTSGKSSKSKSSSKNKDEEEFQIDDGVYFRVNYEHFNIKLRNKLIADAASRRYNEQAGAVMGAMLKAGEPKQKSVREPTSEPIAIHQTASHIPSSISLKRGLALSSRSAISKQSECIAEYCAILAGLDNPGPAGAASRFLLGGKGRSGEYVIAFENACARLKRGVLDALVRDRFGNEGARIVNIVLDKGKLDEKHISTLGLLSMKETRETISRLHSASLLHLQEVPKSADRAVHRTFYLWFVDLPKAYLALLGQLYKTLGNILERKARETHLRADVLARAERSDVKADLGLLGRTDRERLEELDRVMEMLELAQARTELAVFVLRDLPGGPQGSWAEDRGVGAS